MGLGKRIPLVALCVVILLVALAWLRPRVFDDELLFTPETVSLDVERKTDLYRRVCKTPDAVFDEALLGEIQDCLDSRQLLHLSVALSCIETGLVLNVDMPDHMHDREYLRARLVDCLYYELNRLATGFEEYPHGNLLSLTEPADGKKVSDYLSDAFWWLLKEFTFMKNVTLNEYWRRIQAFENGETEDVYRNLRLMDYEWSNLAGEMMLNLAVPPVESFAERIDRVCMHND